MYPSACKFIQRYWITTIQVCMCMCVTRFQLGFLYLTSEVVQW